MEAVIFFEEKESFYSWLDLNYLTKKELWVGYYKTKSNNKSMTWSESVDMALCFGWIDGIRKSIDDQSYKIRFTPRNVKSVWSAVNVKKVKALIPTGLMREEGLALFDKRTDREGYSSQTKIVDLPNNYEDQLKANQSAWSFFSNLAPSYQRNSIWWIMSAKREETRLKRLAVLIDSSEQGLKIPSLRK